MTMFFYTFWLYLQEIMTLRLFHDSNRTDKSLAGDTQLHPRGAGALTKPRPVVRWL